ncbi:MAG: hypothetical protein QOJ51_2541 [Acidobacteriaceae bacterium]|nr:hypothetical protein [Acidobacteriaceae bacterium]
MRFPRVGKQIVAFIVIVLVIAIGAYLYLVNPHHNSASPESAEGLLDRADILAWGNRWIDAQPLYARAQRLFEAHNQSSKALYAQVSQVPANESVNIPETILSLTQDLSLPAATEPETKLRILTIRGMLETNYDAGEARSTWQDVEAQASRLHHFALATRALGEQGIAAFLLGDTNTARKLVVRAWGLSKLENDPAATVRYASVYGAGLNQIHRYEEALTPLNEAIKIATSKPDKVAYPIIAVVAQVDALTGLHRYDEALDLVNTAINRMQGITYSTHKGDLYDSRGTIYSERGNWNLAIRDYLQSLSYARKMDYYRGIANTGGMLAEAYEQNNDLKDALAMINTAIEANKRIPDELFLVPRNLATKAEIIEKMGHLGEAEVLFRKSIALVNEMIQNANAPTVQRQLLSEMSDVYSGYFASLSAQKHYDQALETLEQARGRVETEAIEHHSTEPAHAPTPEEKELTHLNLALIDTDDPQQREALINAIYKTEINLSPSAFAQQTMTHPVRLSALQHALSPEALLIEYVLAEPNSYAFAVTQSSVTPYRLPSKAVIEADANVYRNEISYRKVDRVLAKNLFNELLRPIKEYATKTDLIVVPDGGLHLLPMSALVDDKGSYVLQTHTIAVEPSATVFDLLHNRLVKHAEVTLPYIGVAAWTQTTDDRNFIVRAIAGPERSQLVPLPSSQHEVETIAGDLPRPSQILLGSNATESTFKHLALNSTDVIHLALHGFVDVDYPDRSALVFAPEVSGNEDGLLQVREIRGLNLRARLVTLSACNTGVGPVGEAGVANIVNAFIEAGADSVVSTLWGVEDHSTDQLMATFYAGLAAHDRKVDALRAAQLELVKQTAPPYFWASYQMVGDPNGTL